MKILKLTAISVSLTLASCANITIGGGASKDVVINKSEFIFDCPKEKLQTTCINEVGFISKECYEYGVSGCGHKVIYTRMGNSWIMTSSKNQ